MTEQEKREKVLKGLMVCFTRISCKGKGCPYESEYERSRLCQAHLRDDALALLQSQEPKLVHVTADINRRKVGECPNCGKMINSGDYPNYCGRCGQAVKWDG